MQTVPAIFNQRAKAGIRKLAYQLRVSFDKTLDPSITFFTLDTSLLDGPDILAPAEGQEILDSDKYVYEDYTDRVVQMEWQREESIPYSVNLAMADIVLNNYDKLFTRGAGRPLDANLLPRRPVRLLAGFSDITIPQFVGLTEAVPKADAKAGTASVHAVDFLSFLFSKPLDQTVIYENLRTDEVLDELFQLFGLVPGQYMLDEGYNTIKFVYFEKGKVLGEAVKELMQAELGSLYMDELGIIRFRNRLRPSDPAVLTFDRSNVVDYSISNDSTIINAVEIKSDVREVQASKEVLSLVGTPEDPNVLYAGTETELLFNFNNPVTTIQTIEDIVANGNMYGTGPDYSGNITIDSYEAFATSIKVVFSNSGPQAYLYGLTIMGTPAEVVRSLYFRFQDDASVDEFEEQVLPINNNFIQDNSAAASLALSLLNFYKDFNNTIDMEVKGNFAIQIGDNIDIDLDEISGSFAVVKITNILSDSKFTQRLIAREFVVPSYFTLDESLLDGPEVLAP